MFRPAAVRENAAIAALEAASVVSTAATAANAEEDWKEGDATNHNIPDPYFQPDERLVRPMVLLRIMNAIGETEGASSAIRHRRGYNYEL